MKMHIILKLLLIALVPLAAFSVNGGEMKSLAEHTVNSVNQASSSSSSPSGFGDQDLLAQLQFEIRPGRGSDRRSDRPRRDYGRDPRGFRRSLPGMMRQFQEERQRYQAPRRYPPRSRYQPPRRESRRERDSRRSIRGQPRYYKSTDSQSAPPKKRLVSELLQECAWKLQGMIYNLKIQRELEKQGEDDEFIKDLEFDYKWVQDALSARSRDYNAAFKICEKAVVKVLVKREVEKERVKRCIANLEEALDSYEGDDAKLRGEAQSALDFAKKALPDKSIIEPKEAHKNCKAALKSLHDRPAPPSKEREPPPSKEREPPPRRDRPPRRPARPALPKTCAGCAIDLMNDIDKGKKWSANLRVDVHTSIVEYNECTKDLPRKCLASCVSTQLKVRLETICEPNPNDGRFRNCVNTELDTALTRCYPGQNLPLFRPLPRP